MSQVQAELVTEVLLETVWFIYISTHYVYIIYSQFAWVYR